MNTVFHDHQVTKKNELQTKLDARRVRNPFIYLSISFFFNLGDPFNALALFFLGAQVAQGHT